MKTSKRAFASVRRLAIRKRNQRRYPDSEMGVKMFLEDQLDESVGHHDLEMIPDPQVEDVWLVADHTDEQAFIVYLQGEGSFMTGPGEPDFEEIDYGDAVNQINRRRPW